MDSPIRSAPLDRSACAQANDCAALDVVVHGLKKRGQAAKSSRWQISLKKTLWNIGTVNGRINV